MGFNMFSSGRALIFSYSIFYVVGGIVLEFSLSIGDLRYYGVRSKGLLLRACK